MFAIFKKFLKPSCKVIQLQNILNYRYNSDLLTTFIRSYSLKNGKFLYPYTFRYFFKPFSVSRHNHKELNMESVISTLIKQYSNGKEALIQSKIMSHAALNYIEDPLIQVVNLEEERNDLEALQKEDSSNVEFKKLIDEDLKKLAEKLSSLKKQIYDALLDSQTISDIDEVYVEISAGAGGQEAMLFVQNLLDMYQGLCISNGWSANVVSYDTTPIGGTRHACLLVQGENSYTKLKYEGGIHRVQRVPKTEKAGRIHTSTASVAVLPLPSEISVNISENDLKIEAMRASGPGGQNVNKSNSAIRISHLPSGIVVECQIGRSQEGNKKEAMRKLRAKLYEIETDKQNSEFSSRKKLQVGTKARSEKIRTYNFPQDRVTDHRVGMSVHNIEDILIGGQTLEKLISELVDVGKHEKLIETFSRNIK